MQFIPSSEGGRLSGTVERNFGSPVPGATVRLSTKDSSFSTRPTQQGEFEFRHLPAGLYTLTGSVVDHDFDVVPNLEGFAVNALAIIDGLAIFRPQSRRIDLTEC